MLITTAFIAGAIAALSALAYIAWKGYSLFLAKKSVSVSCDSNKQQQKPRSPTDAFIRRALAIPNAHEVTSTKETSFSFFGRTWFRRRETRSLDIEREPSRSPSPGP